MDCATKVYNCKKGQLSTTDGCVNIEKQGNCATNYDLYFIGTRINSTGPQSAAYEIFDDSTLISCMKRCNDDEQCSLIEFGRNIPNLDSINGTCYLYSNKPEFPVSKTDLSVFYDIKRGGSKCFKYDKEPFNPKSEKIYIDPEKMDKPEKVPIIQSDYMGVNCRRWFTSETRDSEKYADALNDFGEWCSKNPNIDTCKAFANNTEYAKFVKVKQPILLYASVFILLLSLFLLGIFVLRKQGKVYVVLLIILILGSLASTGYSLYKKFVIGDYPGTQKEFASSDISDHEVPDIEGLWKTKKENEYYGVARYPGTNYRYSSCEGDIKKCTRDFKDIPMMWDDSTGVFINSANAQSFDRNGKKLKWTNFDMKTKKVITVDEFEKTDVPKNISDFCNCCNDPPGKTQNVKTCPDDKKQDLKCTFPKMIISCIDGSTTTSCGYAEQAGVLCGCGYTQKLDEEISFGGGCNVPLDGNESLLPRNSDEVNNLCNSPFCLPVEK